MTYGYTEAIIIDLFRYRYLKIPTFMLKILEKYEKSCFEEIQKDIEIEDINAFTSIVEKLYDQDYVGISDFEDKSCWIKWNETNRVGHRIQTAEIHFSSKSTYSISESIKKLAFAGIESLIFYIQHNQINDIIEEIAKSTMDTGISYLGIVYDGQLLIDHNFENSVRQNKRFSDIYAKKIVIKSVKKMRWCNFHIINTKGKRTRFFVDHRLYTELLEGKSKNKLYINENGIVTKEF